MDFRFSKCRLAFAALFVGGAFLVLPGLAGARTVTNPPGPVFNTDTIIIKASLGHQWSQTYCGARLTAPDGTTYSKDDQSPGGVLCDATIIVDPPLQVGTWTWKVGHGEPQAGFSFGWAGPY